MKDNLANRLAAGGFWAIRIASMSVEVAGFLREQGATVPIGSGSDAEVFVMCGMEAFKYFCNANMDVGRIGFQAQMSQVDNPQMYDKNCRPISREHWVQLQQDANYKRVGMWRNDTGDIHVSTVWTGIDPNGCAVAHIFETLVVRMSMDGPRITNVFRTRDLPEALTAHTRVVTLIKDGQL
jgi:hypothetical protein